MERYQKKSIISDLKMKMVILAGPRQAGKTTLAKQIAKEYKTSIYLNYDSADDRRIIKEESWLSSVELIIFDEIHKMPNWKNYIKGVFDTKNDNQKILVTGSVRIKIYNQIGDSLAGKFFLHRLMPLSPAELKNLKIKNIDLDKFLERSGFPEPYLFKNPIDAKRWRMQYVDSLLKVDVLDYENIQNLKAVRLIFEILQKNVGSTVSYSSIAEDVSLSVNTVKKYIGILEALYIIFRVTPFSKNIARSLIKEPKIYFFDPGLVNKDDGAKFENFVAVCLLKNVLSKIDYKAEKYALHFLRTKEKKEVDFAIVKEGKIEKIIEVKKTNHNLSPSLCFFHEKYNLPAVQLVKDLKKEKSINGIEIVRGINFLKSLDL
jgi:uncharacterized protein